MNKFYLKTKTFWLFLLIIVIFAGLAIIFTWPLAKNITSAIPGNPYYSDGPMFLWNLWWTREALASGQNPFFSHIIFYPQAVSLALHTLSLSYGIISIPLQRFFGLVASYNILYLLSFVFSGLGTFYLVDFLVRNRWPAFIAGLAFAFIPYVPAHAYAGHFNLVFIWTIPVFIYLFLKIIEKPKIIHSIFAGIILAIQAYTDFHYLVYLILFMIIWLFWQLFSERKILKSKIFWLNLGLIFASFLLISSPLIFNSVRDYYFSGFRTLAIKEPYNNADLWSFFGANPLNPWWGEQSRIFINGLIGSLRENVLYLGYTIIALAFLGLFNFSDWQKRIFWLVVGLIFFVLALGPNLQIGGEIHDTHLLYYYLTKLPIFDIGLVPTRFAIMAIFAFVILASFGLKDIFELKFFNFVKNYPWRNLIFLIICGMILLEYNPAPIQLDKLSVPEIYKKISQEQGDFIIFSYPFFPMVQYYQTIHHRQILYGNLSRRIQDYYTDYYNQFAGLRILFRPYLPYWPDDSNQEIVFKNFFQFKIRYIIIDKNEGENRYRNLLIDYLDNVLGLKRTYQDDWLIYYKLE